MLCDIEIVVHCWQYSRLLTLQLSSLVLWPPKCRVRYRPCVTAEDTQTIRAVEFFSSRMPATVCVVPLVMEHDRLMRRAIGRNECLLSSRAPIVWAADCDYLATADCLDSILNNWPTGAKLAHPTKVHATIPQHGMEMIEAVGTEPRIVPVDLKADFPLVKGAYSIGGLQFFGGDYARNAGYCNDEPRSRVFRPAKRWCKTLCDRKARLKAGGSKAMNILVLYRVRHTIRSEDHPEDAKL